jgi:hypothetical protein
VRGKQTRSDLLCLVSCLLGLLLEQLFFRRAHGDQLDRQFIDLAGEPERRLVVLVLHARAGIHPDIESLVDGRDERNGVRDRITGDFLAIYRQTPVPPFTKPGPSYLKSNKTVCLPGVSAAWPSHRKRARAKKLYTKTGLPLSK